MIESFGGRNQIVVHIVILSLFVLSLGWSVVVKNTMRHFWAFLLLLKIQKSHKIKDKKEANARRIRDKSCPEKNYCCFC